jgi:4-amino-4-deoxy-L-arabinose transferase-like glycosyltransferase
MDATGNGLGTADILRTTLNRARAVLITYRVEALCAGILLAMALNMVFVTARKSITADEIVLIPAAYYHLITNDPQLVREHPPLCKLLAGVPLLFIQPQELLPNQLEPSQTRPDREWAYSMRFWQDNRAQFEAISFWARVPMIALTLAFGLLTFVFTRELFGSRAALFALALFALEPTLLAHGRVVQTDVVAAFGFLLTVFAVHRYLRAASWKWAAGVGAAAGLAMLTKFSMVILGPGLSLLFIALLWRRRPLRKAITRHGMIATLTLLLVINAGYFFNHRALTDDDTKWIATSFPAQQANVLTSVRVLKVLLPPDFLMGVYWQLHHSSQGHPAGLLGMYSLRGWWYYFPVAFALKTTIPFLLLSISALAWAWYRVFHKREKQLLLLLLPFAVYTAFVMMSPIDIGIRYYLPAFAFLFILGGALLDSLLRRSGSKQKRMALTAVVFVALSWMGWEAIRAYPNYMPYMNQLASGRPHWWYLSDSNVEWGESVKEVAEYLRARGETRTRALLLGGYVTLGFYGVEYLDALAPASPSPPRYLVLGASFLNGATVPGYDIDGKRVPDAVRVNTFDEFRHRAPEAVIGDSIYVFRVAE